MTVGLHTNGSIRTESWWASAGRLLTKPSYARCAYMCVSLCIYVSIQRERERERVAHTLTYIYIYIYIYVNTNIYQQKHTYRVVVGVCTRAAHKTILREVRVCVCVVMYVHIYIHTRTHSYTGTHRDTPGCIIRTHIHAACA